MALDETRAQQLAPLRAAEFFAGIGLVRLGLEQCGFRVVWSNDWEPVKREMYARQFSDADETYRVGDVAEVNGAHLPDIDLAWASFPCTDLSLAGWRRGLAGEESRTFYSWTRILGELGARRPRVVAAENVIGLATSRGGDDLRAAVRELNALGYSVDVLALDARRFVPQSRPRLILVGSLDDVVESVVPSTDLRPDWLSFIFDDERLRTHRAPLPPPPDLLVSGFSDVADRLEPGDQRWWDDNRVDAFLESLSDVQRARLDRIKGQRRRTYRTAYRRTRNGVAVWEIRSDDIAGCLRTARGGSSKQAVVQAGSGSVRVRWMTPLEYTKLMGAAGYNIDGLRPLQVMFGCGDAVAVPVIEWLARHYLGPLARGALRSSLAVAGA